MKIKNLFRPNQFKPSDPLKQMLLRQRAAREKLYPQQDMTEFSGFLRLLVQHNVRSYLEIGCRYGGTFNMIMRVLPEGSKGVAVDLPGGNWGEQSSVHHLQSVVDGLKEDGIQADLLLGNSQSEEIRNAVSKFGPFDAALIDGDHLYEGVKADWEFYGKLAGIVAFHDVAGEQVRQMSSGLPVEVPRLWREIKASGLETTEFIREDSGMGIGVVLQQHG